jgi:hypothetical protein
MIRRLCCTGALVLGLLVASVPTAHAATVSPSEWAPAFCTALTDWQATIQEKGDAMSTELESVTDLSEGREQIAGFLGEMVDATDDATSAIKAAGRPSSPNGGKIAALFVKGFTSISKVFARAHDQAEKLPISSPQKFKVAGKKLGQALSDSSDALGAGFASVDELDKGKKLEAAVKAAPECAAIA